MSERDDQDRPPSAGAPPSLRPPRAPAAYEELPEIQRILAVFGPNQRSGYWEPPERLEAVSLFGSVRLDFNEANLYEGVTEVRCLAVFGSIEIHAPRQIDVDANGTGIFGAFEQRAPRKKWLEGLGRRLRGESADEPGPAPPADAEPALLRIRGFSIFGSVTVRVG